MVLIHVLCCSQVSSLGWAVWCHHLLHWGWFWTLCCNGKLRKLIQRGERDAGVPTVVVATGSDTTVTPACDGFISCPVLASMQPHAREGVSSQL